jgi:hypothetical protein
MKEKLINIIFDIFNRIKIKMLLKIPDPERQHPVLGYSRNSIHTQKYRNAILAAFSDTNFNIDLMRF